MSDDVGGSSIEGREQPQRIGRELPRRIQPRRARRPTRPAMVEGDDGVASGQPIDDVW
jgi:hypothetical protein